jgi:hypothetical protein
MARTHCSGTARGPWPSEAGTDALQMQRSKPSPGYHGTDALQCVLTQGKAKTREVDQGVPFV